MIVWIFKKIKYNSSRICLKIKNLLGIKRKRGLQEHAKIDRLKKLEDEKRIRWIDWLKGKSKWL